MNEKLEINNQWIEDALVNKNEYESMYQKSIEDNEVFWNENGKRIDWIKQYTKIKDIKYSSNEVKINWYYDGTLNASINCIDRHAKKIQIK